MGDIKEPKVPHDMVEKIMQEYKKQLTAAYTRGVVVGLKLGANYVREKLKSPKDWADMDATELFALLSEGVTMNDAIQNGKLGIDPAAVKEEDVETEDDEEDEVEEDEDIGDDNE